MRRKEKKGDLWERECAAGRRDTSALSASDTPPKDCERGEWGRPSPPWASSASRGPRLSAPVVEGVLPETLLLRGVRGPPTMARWILDTTPLSCVRHSCLRYSTRISR
jgi:hypothetical protein